MNDNRVLVLVGVEANRIWRHDQAVIAAVPGALLARGSRTSPHKTMDSVEHGGTGYTTVARLELLGSDELSRRAGVRAADVAALASLVPAGSAPGDYVRIADFARKRGPFRLLPAAPPDPHDLSRDDVARLAADVKRIHVDVQVLAGGAMLSLARPGMSLSRPQRGRMDAAMKRIDESARALAAALAEVEAIAGGFPAPPAAPEPAAVR